MKSHFKHLSRDENTLIVTFVLTSNLWMPPELLLQLTRPSARAPHRGTTAPRVFSWARWTFHFYYSTYYHCQRGRRAARALSRPRGTSVNDPSEIVDKVRQHLFCWICNVQKNAPIKQTKMAKHGRVVNIPKWSKEVQKGPKLKTWMFLTIWGPFGSIWTLFNHFRQKSICCPIRTK